MPTQLSTAGGDWSGPTYQRPTSLHPTRQVGEAAIGKSMHRLGLAPQRLGACTQPLSHSLLATCYDPLHAKNGPISICGCKLPLSGRDTSRFYGISLGGCCDVVATTKNWFSKKVNARHPLEFSRERSSKNLVACSQPETSSLRNIGSDVDGF